MVYNKKKVSIIMNCHNGEDYLTESIQSVYNQTYKDWEIIFWDNASTDKTKKIVKSFDKKIKYYFNPLKVSLGQARNQAIKEAHGEFIAFLDCDDIWLEEKLEKQLECFQSNEVNLVFTDVLYFGNNNSSFILYNKKKYFEGNCFHNLLDDFYLCLSSVVIRQLVLDKLDEVFDPQFELVEEADLFLRIAFVSKIKMVDQVLTKYRIHEKALSTIHYDLHWKERYQLKNKFKKKYPKIYNQYLDNFLEWKNKGRLTRVHGLILKYDRSKARRLLYKMIINYKNIILIFISFLPINIIKLIYKLQGNYR